VPASVNGVGTAYCGHAAPILWQRPGSFSLTARADHDAVECVTLLFLPLFPLRAYHTFNWSGNECRAIRIKTSGRLLARAYLRPYVLVLLGVSIFLMVVSLAAIGIALFMAEKSAPITPKMMLGFATPPAGLLLGLFLKRSLDRLYARSRDIRLVIGPHELGSSDPATWTEETLSKAEDAAPGGGLDAARRALSEGRFGEAMWAARLAVARGQAEGETLTDEILSHAQVASILPDLRKAPWRREELLPRPRE
jgi:hypothetical protein